MNLATILKIYSFLRTIAPLVGSIYAAVRDLFPDGTPGAVKLDAFKAMVQQLLQSEEFKRYEGLFNDAWPFLQTMVEAFHTQAKAVAAAGNATAPASDQTAA